MTKGEVDKSRAQLLTEVTDLRARIAELEARVVDEAARWKRIEETYRAILRTAMDGFCITDAQGRLLDVNDVYCDLVGYTRDELLRMSIADVEARQSGEETLRQIQRVIKDRHARFETRHRSKDGQIIEIEVSANCVADDDNRFIVFLRDITERVAAELERERLLHDMGERVKELTCMYGVEDLIRRQDSLETILRSVAALIPPAWHYPGITRGRIRFDGEEYASAPFLETAWRLTSDIIVGGARRGVVEVYYLEERPTLDEGPFLRQERDLIDGIGKALSEAIERKGAEEALQEAHDELERRVAARTAELAEKNRWLQTEIVERERSESALRESEERIRAIVETALDAVIMMDSGGHVAGWSPHAEEIFGWSADEVIGRPLVEIIVPAEFREAHSAGLARFLATGESSVLNHRLEMSALRKDGQVIPVELSIAPIRIGDEYIFSSFVRDISERRQAEIEKRQLEEQLHQAQKMEAVGQLAGGVAHDFNNLLTAILGNIDIIASLLPDNEVVKSAARAIREATEQAVAVTRSLLAFSRELPAEKKRIRLQEVVQDSSPILQRLLPANIEVAIDAPPEPPLWVNGDMTQLQQVVLNLAINARDSMPDGGRLSIAVSPASPAEVGELADSQAPGTIFASLVVSDTGAGIRPEVLSRLFEPFYSTKPRGQGTGLGLSIVHGIVRNHEGSITVATEVGRGATFTVNLPCVGPVGAAAVMPSNAEVPRGAGETVLVAEASQFVREAIFSTLVLLGYDVLRATDGTALLEEFRANRDCVRLLIVDASLPGRDGLDCLADLRAEGIRTPAILMTARLEKDVSDRIDRETSLLQKPFQMAEVARRVHDLLHGKHLPETRS